MAKVLVVFLFFLFFLFLEAGEIFKQRSFKELRSENVVRQTFEESCGASSLATLMNMYGFKYSEKDLIKELNTTDIVSFANLADTGVKFNF